MTSQKGQSDNASSAENNANLGQNNAAQEKKSAAKLGEMGEGQRSPNESNRENEEIAWWQTAPGFLLSVPALARRPL